MEVASRSDFVLIAIIAVAIAAAMIFRVRRPAPAAVPPAVQPPGVLLRDLLPAEPPVVDGLRISWSYVPATSAAAAGGDFYDAFFLDDGTLAIAIGEAAGGGAAAIAAMNTVRQAIRSALLDGARPADALRRANRVLLRSERPGIVTALTGIIDPATLQLRYAGAGHPPPLLAGADEACVPLPGEGSGIALGVMPLHVTSEYVVAIPDDAVLALYTDGCLTPGDERELLAAALVETRKLAPNKPAPTIDRAIFGERPRPDDATIFTLSPEAQIAHLDVRLPADPPSAALARTALRRFLASTPLDERRAYDALVATGEAVANAIEHAYDGRANHTFVLRGRYEERRCTILVEDAGTWNDIEPAATRGAGITMMRELCDTLEISRTQHGTSVMLEFLIVPNLADASLVKA